MPQRIFKHAPGRLLKKGGVFMSIGSLCLLAGITVRQLGKNLEPVKLWSGDAASGSEKSISAGNVPRGSEPSPDFTGQFYKIVCGHLSGSPTVKPQGPLAAPGSVEPQEFLKAAKSVEASGALCMAAPGIAIFTGPASETYGCIYQKSSDTFFMAGPLWTAITDLAAEADGTSGVALPCFHGLGPQAQYEAALRLPVCPLKKFCCFMALLCQCLAVECPEGEQLHDICKARLPQKCPSPDFDSFLYEQRERRIAHLGYPQEQQLLECVRRGDVSSLDGILGQLLYSFSASMSDDEREQALFAMIAITTLVTRAAMAGGLNRNTAYNLSDAYIRRSRRCRTTLDIRRLFRSMVTDFTTQVASSHKPGVYSEMTNHMVEYILSNLHDRITLDTLAESVHRTPGYVSAVFKKETGMTVSEFVRHERMREAKSLLGYTDMPCNAIAAALGYSGQSYFTEVFRSECGMTPAQYRAARHFS